jgi:hypothetical protein
VIFADIPQMQGLPIPGKPLLDKQARVALAGERLLRPCTFQLADLLLGSIAWSARAIDEISENIQAIQAATARAVSEIRLIAEVAHRSREIATGIAGAVEEQSAATREISSSVSRAATGAQMVADNISTVDENITEASGAARELLSASHELSSEFHTLERQVQTFVRTVRGGK